MSDDHPKNVDVAQRLGFLDGLSQQRHGILMKVSLSKAPAAQT